MISETLLSLALLTPPGGTDGCVLTCTPSAAEEGDTVSLTVDTDGHFRGNRVMLMVGTTLDPDGRFILDYVPFAFTRTSSGGYASKSIQLPVGTDGSRFYLQAFGSDPDFGVWYTNLPQLAVGTSDADWILSPLGGGQWEIRDVDTGATRSSQTPMMTVYGADHRSTSAQNRPPMKKPGDVIELAPGAYPMLTLSMSYDYDPAYDKNGNGRVDGVAERNFGKDPQTIIRATVPGSAHIENGQYDGIYHEWNGAVTIEGIVFDGHGRASVKTENPGTGTGGGRWNNGLAHQGFRDVEYRECSIIGPLDGYTGVSDSPYAKWGFQTYEMGPSARGTYGFIWSGGVVQGMEPQNGEHAFYFHNTYATDARGNPDPNGLAVLIENAVIRWCMRTAFQDVNRTYEGPDGKGMIHIRNCYIEDVCLESGGGGSALTFRGNRDGKVLIENTTVKLGCDPQLNAKFQGNITGAMVVDQGSGTGGRGTREVEIRDCWFEVGKVYGGVSSARRTNVNISSVDRFSLINSTIINHPNASSMALSVDMNSVKQVVLDDDCVIKGDVAFYGVGTFKDPNRDGSGYRAALKTLATHPQVIIQ